MWLGPVSLTPGSSATNVGLRINPEVLESTKDTILQVCRRVQHKIEQ